MEGPAGTAKSRPGSAGPLSRGRSLWPSTRHASPSPVLGTFLGDPYSPTGLPAPQNTTPHPMSAFSRVWETGGWGGEGAKMRTLESERGPLGEPVAGPQESDAPVRSDPTAPLQARTRERHQQLSPHRRATDVYHSSRATAKTERSPVSVTG